MASRENSGLHAALIIFVLITVVLTVTTYYYYRSAQEEENLRIAKAEETKLVKEKIKDMSEDVKILLYVLGWETNISKDEVEGTVKGLKPDAASRKVYEGFKQDMAKWGEGIENPNYRNVYESLVNALKAKSEQIVTAVNGKRKEEVELVAVTKRETDASATHDAAAKKAQADLAAQTAKFDADRKKLNDEKAKLQKDKDDIATKLNNAEEKYKKIIAENEKLLKKKDEVVALQKDEIDRTKKAEDFEVPDGVINSVNQRTNSVLINLGSADGMRVQVTFSVYDRSQNSATKSKKKGGIEVTKVLDEHTSEARITKDSLADPILPGDQIYSPIWHQGPRLHFALTGWLDIDNDGENDRQVVRNLIEINGGIIDAEQQDDGKETGKMTFQTKYLIDMHELPERSADLIRGTRNSMILKAKDLGIKRVYVKELLDYMGWKGAEKTVRLGTGSGVIDKDRKDGDFRPRTPPAANKEGAFP